MRIAVIGPGAIGASLALACTLHGHTTKLHGRKGGSFDRARALIATGLKELSDAGLLPAAYQGKNWRQDLLFSDDEVESETDLVVEAVNEDLALKQAIFAQLDRRLPADTILAQLNLRLAGGRHRGQLRQSGPHRSCALRQSSALDAGG